MKVVTDITRIDLIKFNLSLIPRVKSTYISMLVVITFVFIFLSWTKGFPETSSDWLAISMGSIGGGIAAMLFGFAVSIISTAFMSTQSNGVLGKHEYHVTSDGLYEKTSANESLNKWEGIKSISRVGSYILFQISGYLYHVIPKNSFESPEKLEEFILFSKEQWGNVHNK